MSFKSYIKAVGTGPKGNRDLDDKEIDDAISQILNKEATNAQIGAFLVAWRTKLEATSELKAMVKTLKKYVKYTPIENSIELGYSFDGRVKNPFLFPLYDDILKSFYQKNSDIQPLNIVISGDYLQPAKNGITTKDIFDNLDSTQYLHFFDRKDYLTKLSELTDLRMELGLRTAFNTVEKLLNPSNSQYGVTTAFHKPYVQKYLDIFGEYYEDIIVLKASEGSPEVFKNGKYWIKENNEIIEKPFELENFGIKTPKEYKHISLEEALSVIKNPDDNLINLAKFNVALYLLFSKRVNSLEEAWDRLN